MIQIVLLEQVVNVFIVTMHQLLFVNCFFYYFFLKFFEYFYYFLGVLPGGYSGFANKDILTSIDSLDQCINQNQCQKDKCLEVCKNEYLCFYKAIYSEVFGEVSVLGELIIFIFENLFSNKIKTCIIFLR